MPVVANFFVSRISYPCPVKKTEKELVTNKDKWYFCFRNMHRLERMPKELKSKLFERLFHVTEIESLPKEERIKYIKEMTTERDIRNQIVYALVSKCTGLSEQQIRNLQI